VVHTKLAIKILSVKLDPRLECRVSTIRAEKDPKKQVEMLRNAAVKFRRKFRQKS